MPTVAQFKQAFLAIKDEITPKQSSMLKAHYAAAGHSATMAELARAGGYESYAVANLQYGKLVSNWGLIESPNNSCNTTA